MGCALSTEMYVWQICMSLPNLKLNQNVWSKNSILVNRQAGCFAMEEMILFVKEIKSYPTKSGLGQHVKALNTCIHLQAGSSSAWTNSCHISPAVTSAHWQRPSLWCFHDFLFTSRGKMHCEYLWISEHLWNMERLDRGQGPIPIHPLTPYPFPLLTPTPWPDRKSVV